MTGRLPLVCRVLCFPPVFETISFDDDDDDPEKVEEEENLYFSKGELRELALVEIYFKQIPELHKFRTTVRPDVFSGGCTAAEHYFSTIQ